MSETAGSPPPAPVESGSPAPQPSTARVLLGAAAALTLLAVMIWAVVSLYRGPSRAGSGPGPGHFGQVPAFSLTESRGATVTAEDLKGKIWIADFIFTRCTSICPLLSASMVKVQSTLKGRGDVRLVSISVDPEYDTPEVLDRYADRFRADRALWLFLTGDWMAIHRLVGDGFKLAVERGDPNELPVGELVTHSDRMVLVDREGRIRGYYHGTEEEGVSLLLRDLDLVLGED